MILTPPERRWECPNCDRQHADRRSGGPPYHACAGLKGLSAPFVPAGTRAKVSTAERGDYIGTDVVQLDADGRPVMAIVTERDDGTDCAVLAPAATGRQG